jgi:tol-pal system protein YbgF
METTDPPIEKNHSVRGHMTGRRRGLVAGTLLLLLLAHGLFGCATTDETALLSRNVASLQSELYQYREETNARLSGIARDNENLRRQLVALYTASDSKDEKTKAVLGKIDELEHQIQTYWNDTKAQINALKQAITAIQQQQKSSQPPPKPVDVSPETVYKEAFEAFQRGAYEDAVKRFTTFVETFPEAQLKANAHYWIGESYMGMRNYEKAILSFEEVIDKYPTSEKTPRALLSQAEAFSTVHDKKSSITILKKVIELFPKSEEATIAERKLRALNP